MSDGLRAFSYGGGVQSTAALVLAAQGRIDYQTFLFANVGEDSENPETILYFHDHAMPFAREHGLDLIELRRYVRGPRPGNRTLMEEIDGQPRSVPIPIRLVGGGFGTRRCTDRFKIRVVGRWTKEHGATVDEPATVGIGFSIDEYTRATNASPVRWERRDYPLLDLRVSRSDCRRIVADAGLPVPPKSSCYFCPFKGMEDWRRLHRDRPDLFEKAVRLEAKLGDRREALGHDRGWLSPLMRPLPAVLDQGELFEDEATCDAFSCFT